MSGNPRVAAVRLGCQMAYPPLTASLITVLVSLGGWAGGNFYHTTSPVFLAV